MTPEEAAWAGGLFEGEGCISIETTQRPYGTYRYVRLGLGMTDLDTVERFQRAVGVGNIHCKDGARARRGWKPLHRWEITGKKALPVLHALMPYLGSRRRERAAEVLETVYGS